jgi:phenylacetic acid degradation operon negative regulatory protein
MSSLPDPFDLGPAPLRTDRATADFPRPLRGSSTQHLLITLLTEVWQSSEAWIPSRLVVALAGDLDVTPSAATTALSRLATRRVLEQSNAGRSSRYRFTPNARARLTAAIQRVVDFGSGGRAWDGRWTVIAFSIPEASRDVRELFRNHLKFRGFAPIYGALWVSPWERPEDLEAGCAAFGVTDFVIFRTADDSLRGKSLIRAWPLEELGEQYQPFIDRFRPWVQRCAAGEVVPADAFRVRVQAMDTWRTFPSGDPDLPLELLPDRWQLTEARSVFMGLYECLAEPALEHVRQVVARHAPQLGEEITILRPASAHADPSGTTEDSSIRTP